MNRRRINNSDPATLTDAGAPLSAGSAAAFTDFASAFQISWGKLLAVALLILVASNSIDLIIYRTRKDDEGL